MSRRWDDNDLDQLPPGIRKQIVEKSAPPRSMAGTEEAALVPRAGTARRSSIEQDLQIACVSWADKAIFPEGITCESRWLLPPVKIGDFLHHTPNGGARSAAEGGIFKAMGVRRGYPDLSLDLAIRMDDGQFIPGFRCELKTDTGNLSPDQQMRLEQLQRAGYFVCIERNLEGFIHSVDTYLAFGKPLHKAFDW